jgi:hypothetical protein
VICADTALILALASHRTWERPVADGDNDNEHGLVAMITGVSSLRAAHWADLCAPEWHPVWDALAVGLTRVTGYWAWPRTGLEIVDAVLRWERTLGCAEDVRAVLIEAAAYSAGAKEFVHLSPNRWARLHLRVVGGLNG